MAMSGCLPETEWERDPLRFSTHLGGGGKTAGRIAKHLGLSLLLSRAQWTRLPLPREQGVPIREGRRMTGRAGGTWRLEPRFRYLLCQLGAAYGHRLLIKEEGGGEESCNNYGGQLVARLNS